MYSTFNLTRRIVRGSLREAALAAHEHLHEAGVVIFDESTFNVVDVDLSGSAEDVAWRIDSYPQQGNSKPNRRRGRPKLGVIGREVTLLPRHWECAGCGSYLAPLNPRHEEYFAVRVQGFHKGVLVNLTINSHSVAVQQHIQIWPLLYQHRSQISIVFSAKG